MKLLFIHKNFPGQYLYLAQYLRAVPGNEVIGVGEQANITSRGTIEGMRTIGYPTPQGAGPGTHGYLQSAEAAVRRGQAVGRVLLDLRQEGFEPDVIAVHPAWGEGLFVRDIFPKAPILMYAEFLFKANEADLSFDPEYRQPLEWSLGVPLNNTAQTLSFMTANACISPTAWQASRYPEYARRVTRVIHDGIETTIMRPRAGMSLTIQPLAVPGESRIIAHSADGVPPGLGKNDVPKGEPLTLSGNDEIIVYMARNLEPHRGFHVFMRTLPEILRRRPKAQVLIIGHDGVSYSLLPPDGQTYKSMLLKEVGDSLDYSRVHFLGRIPYSTLRTIFRISSVHVYLTYPFVLSWSVMEAMACECLVVGSDTEPVREVITHGVNGLLTDFFDQGKLADTIEATLADPAAFAPLRKAARQSILETYDLRTRCLPAQVQFLNDIHAGMYPAPR